MYVDAARFTTLHNEHFPAAAPVSKHYLMRLINPAVTFIVLSLNQKCHACHRLCSHRRHHQEQSRGTKVMHQA